MFVEILIVVPTDIKTMDVDQTLSFSSILPTYDMPPFEEIPAIVVTTSEESPVIVLTPPEENPVIEVNPPAEERSLNAPPFPVDLMPDLIPDQIIPRLYISSMVTAEIVVQNFWELPDTPRFTHVLSIHSGQLADQQRLLPPAGSTLQCKEILLGDSPNVDMVEWFPEICQFIHQAFETPSNNILVHCYAGRSRSVTAVAAYLMWALHLDRDDALIWIASKRQRIWPNTGFTLQLELWGELDCNLLDMEETTASFYVDHDLYAVAKWVERWESDRRSGEPDIGALLEIERPNSR